jgi:hypothetical protein
MIGFTNPPISEALVAGHAKQILDAFGIHHLERRAAIVTKIELGKVAMQMHFAAMLIDADHTAQISSN